MRKILLLLTILGLSFVSFAEESRLFVAPGRETFFAFPSALLGDKYTLTVFLPTQVAPISKHYPVVYFIGLDRSDREGFQRFAQENGVFLAGLFIPEEEMENVLTVLPDFMDSEWVPYMDTNYATVASPEGRILATRGEVSARVAMQIFSKGNFGALSLLNPGSDLPDMILHENERVFVCGTQEELAAISRVLEKGGAQYGAQYALDYSSFEEGWLDALNVKYLLAKKQDLKVKKIDIKTGVKTLSVSAGKSVSLKVSTRLENGMKTIFIPQEVRTSPPFLDWQDGLGVLRVRAGAEPGVVKIKISVDNVENSTQIMLKKQ